MGNRGCLHDATGQIRRPYRGKRWIICRLDFKGRRRSIMTPGRYTELFFLDEATALAAGHRPCFECQRDRFKRFQSLWARANPGLVDGSKPAADTIDTVLHRERITPDGQKATYFEPLASLPDGTFVALKGQPYLLFKQTLLPWTPNGYDRSITQPADQVMQVLTPQSVVQTLAGGYRVTIHSSASGASRTYNDSL